MKFIIVGCGRMGSGLARALIQRGHGVTAVDNDPAALARLGKAFAGATVVGIGFDRDVLLQAGIERADGLAAVSSSDEANVVIARLASQVFRVPRVVARLYDPSRAEIYRRLGVQTITPVLWGINRVADLLCYSQLHAVMSLGSGEVDIVEVALPPLLIGRSISTVTIAGAAHVVAISRRGRTFLPLADVVFQEGDVMHLAVVGTSIDRLAELLGLQ